MDLHTRRTPRAMRATRAPRCLHPMLATLRGPRQAFPTLRSSPEQCLCKMRVAGRPTRPQRPRCMPPKAVCSPFHLRGETGGLTHTASLPRSARSSPPCLVRAAWRQTLGACSLDPPPGLPHCVPFRAAAQLTCPRQLRTPPSCHGITCCSPPSPLPAMHLELRRQRSEVWGQQVRSPATARAQRAWP